MVTGNARDSSFIHVSSARTVTRYSLFFTFSSLYETLLEYSPFASTIYGAVIVYTTSPLFSSLITIDFSSISSAVSLLSFISKTY